MPQYVVGPTAANESFVISEVQPAGSALQWHMFVRDRTMNGNNVRHQGFPRGAVVTAKNNEAGQG